MQVKVPDDQTRFECDLDFVFMLSNEAYIQYLIDNNYFQEKEFQDYIHYLQYLRQPVYIRFVTNMKSLFYLERLNDPKFRQSLPQLAVNSYFQDEVLNSTLKYYERYFELYKEQSEYKQEIQDQISREGKSERK